MVHIQSRSWKVIGEGGKERYTTIGEKCVVYTSHSETVPLLHLLWCSEAERQILLVQGIAMLSCKQYFAILKREKDASHNSVSCCM